jgi:hypothetical protein
VVGRSCEGVEVVRPAGAVQVGPPGGYPMFLDSVPSVPTSQLESPNVAPMVWVAPDVLSLWEVHDQGGP